MRAPAKASPRVRQENAVELEYHGGDSIGWQLRRLRRKHGITLDVLAERSFLTKSYLSRVERGEKSPSVAAVIRLAQALKVPVSTLFGETIEDAAIHLVRSRSISMEESAFRDGSYPFYLLSKTGENSKIECFVMLPPEDFSPEGLIDHPGEEAFYVMEGKVEVSFSDRSIAMSVGDYLQFPGQLKHRVRRLSAVARVLIFVVQY